MRKAILAVVASIVAVGCSGAEESDAGPSKGDAAVVGEGSGPADSAPDEGPDGPLVTIPVPSPCEMQCDVATVAGNGAAGFADGDGPVARFDEPTGAAVSSTHTVFVADRRNHRVRWIAAATTVPTVETYAGGGAPDYVDGPASTAAFSSPSAVAVGAGDVLFVADTNNHRIRKIEDGVVSTAAGSGPSGALLGDHLDGSALAARFDRPEGVAVSATGALVVADTGNHVVRVVEADFVTTIGLPQVSGHLDGAGNTARFDEPTGVAIGSDGALYVADRGNRRIRRVRRDASIVETLAGSGADGSEDGRASAATFTAPRAVAVDAQDRVFVADGDRLRVVRSDGRGLVVETLAGASAGFADGSAATARFSSLGGIGIGAEGRIFLADTGNQRVRVLSPRP